MLKKSLLISSALLLSLSLPSKNMAMMDDDDNPSNLSTRPATVKTEQGSDPDSLKNLPGPAMERVMHYLTPGALLDLSKTSKGLQAVANPHVKKARKNLISLRSMLRNVNGDFVKKLKASRQLPEQERRNWLINQLQNREMDVDDRIKAAKNLPVDNKVRMAALYALVQKQGVDAENRLKAAKKLPVDNKVRMAALSAIAKNPQENEKDRLEAAKLIPEGNPFHTLALAAIARDREVEADIRIEAAAALPASGKLRTRILYEIIEDEIKKNELWRMFYIRDAINELPETDALRARVLEESED